MPEQESHLERWPLIVTFMSLQYACMSHHISNSDIKLQSKLHGTTQNKSEPQLVH